MIYNISSIKNANSDVLKLLIENNDPYYEYNITISDGITKIRDFAFYKKGYLRSITIPKSVKYIGTEAFHYCLNLSTFIYLGTISEWNTIEFGSRWNDVSAFSKIICADGEISMP